MGPLYIETVPTDLFGANAYLVYTQDQPSALLVDAGVGTARRVQERLRELGKRVGAVLLTHGHPDHIWEAAAVAELSGNPEPAPVYLPAPDMVWLSDPMKQLGLPDVPGLNQEWVAPAVVTDAPTGSWQVLPGVTVRVVPAPGHSAGSSIMLIAGDVTIDGEPADAPVAFAGDVVFLGSIGRTDLPGGDDLVMKETLRTLAAALDPGTVLLPGHGPQTLWADELRTNPYVLGALER